MWILIRRLYQKCFDSHFKFKSYLERSLTKCMLLMKQESLVGYSSKHKALEGLSSFAGKKRLIIVLISLVGWRLELLNLWVGWRLHVNVCIMIYWCIFLCTILNTYSNSMHHNKIFRCALFFFFFFFFFFWYIVTSPQTNFYKFWFISGNFIQGSYYFYVSILIELEHFLVTHDVTKSCISSNSSNFYLCQILQLLIKSQMITSIYKELILFLSNFTKPISDILVGFTWLGWSSSINMGQHF